MENYPLEIVERVSDFLLTGSPPDPLQSWAWLPALVMGAVSLINSISQRRSDKKNQERQNAANLQLADKQFQQNQQQIEEMNKYNDPAAQMRRFEGAGLNPNLIYGSGSAGAGNQTQAAKYEAPQMSFNARAVQLPEMLGQYQDFQLRQAQIDNVRAGTEEKHSQIMTDAIRRFVMEIQGKTGAENLYRSQVTREDQIQAVQEKSRQSVIRTDQELSRLRQMSQTEIQQLLDAEYKRKAMKAVDIDNEKRQADLLFKTYRNQWMKEGITTSDNMYLRILVRMLNEVGLSPMDYNPFK